MIDQIRDWVGDDRSGWRVPGFAHDIIDGLDIKSDDSWIAACRRYKAHIDEQRRDRAKRKAEREAPPPEKACSFCGKPQSKARVLVGDGAFAFICDRCVGKAMKVVARAKRKDRGRAR